MQGEESYVWATVYAAVVAVHDRESAAKEADKALEAYRERVEKESRARGKELHERDMRRGL